MAKGLAVTGDLAAAAEQIKGLYKLFDSCDCTMVEVCSLIEGGGINWGIPRHGLHGSDIRSAWHMRFERGFPRLLINI